jgi:hypothetical protein
MGDEVFKLNGNDHIGRVCHISSLFPAGICWPAFITVTAPTTPGFCHYTVTGSDGTVTTQGGWIVVGNPAATLTTSGSGRFGTHGTTLSSPLTVTLNPGLSGEYASGAGIFFHHFRRFALERHQQRQEGPSNDQRFRSCIGHVDVAFVTGNRNSHPSVTVLDGRNLYRNRAIGCVLEGSSRCASMSIWTASFFNQFLAGRQFKFLENRSGRNQRDLCRVRSAK